LQCLALAAVRLGGPYWWHSEDIDEPTARGAIFRAYELKKRSAVAWTRLRLPLRTVTNDGTEPDVSGLEQADIAALDKYLQSEISTQFAIEGES